MRSLFYRRYPNREKRRYNTKALYSKTQNSRSMRCHVEDVCRRMLIFSRKVLKDRGKRTRCPRQPIVDMDVDCRRPRHDKNYSSLFVENSHPETLHRDMCIACSGSSWILPMYSTNFQFTCLYSYPPDGNLRRWSGSSVSRTSRCRSK